MKWPLRSFFIAIILFFVFHYTFASYSRNRAADLIKRGVFFVSQPFVHFVLDVKTGFKNTAESYFFLVGVAEENRSLKGTLQELKIQNHLLRQELKQYARAEEAEKNYSFLGENLKRVRILGYDPLSYSKTLLIDAGRNRDISLNDAVVSGEGLVGRVIEVQGKSAKVLLLADERFSVDTVNERTQLRCLVKGLSLDVLQATRYPYLSQVEFLEQGHDLQEGDFLKTSGFGGIFPGGIPVGKVMKLENQHLSSEKILILPQADLSKLSQLYVLGQKS